MAWNLWMTARSGKAVNGEVEVVKLAAPATAEAPWWKVAFGAPVLLAAVTMTLFASVAVLSQVASITMAAVAVFVSVAGTIALQIGKGSQGGGWHRLVEGRAIIFSGLTLVAVLIGGVMELIPSLVNTRHAAHARPTPSYTGLELEGRDIYIREGCYNCHSQMIRPMRPEAIRYGEPSTVEESIFDHPFQWGSKRTGPDLAREGGRYPNLWHYRHLPDPRPTPSLLPI